MKGKEDGRNYFTSTGEHPALAAAAIIGLCFGIFYGFDGWRGDTADIALEQSPRVKNMIWVLGGGFASFTGVLALDPMADKAPVLVAYLAPFLVASVVVVTFWGAVVALGQALTRSNYGYGTAEAVGDYFFYGYRHYRAKIETARENQSNRFHTTYLDQLTLAIAAAGWATDANRLATVRGILGSIAAVIRSYHRDENNSKGIRANVMIVRECDDKLRQRLRFIGDAKPARITRCLELITYDVPQNEPGIILPISENLNTALPGAPTAFLNPDRFAVMDDTLQIAYAQGVSEQIRTEIDEYFRHRAFRSFGSIQILGPNASTLGVINVESRITHVFGRTEDERRNLIHYLLPFCAALAIVYSNA